MSISLRVKGDYGLFTNPLTKTSGEKCSYFVPTYEACKGILESIYWKPSFVWVIDKVRIINPIQLETKGTKIINVLGNEQQLAFYTYLREVEYEIQAHFVFVKNRIDLYEDFNANKHIAIATKSLKKGGRRDVYLGSRECYADVKPCVFGEKPSFYDGKIKEIGNMFFKFDYGTEMIDVYFADIKIENGIIDFSKLKSKKVNTIKNTMTSKEFIIEKNMSIEKVGEN